jgi:hypothetical protein
MGNKIETANGHDFRNRRYAKNPIDLRGRADECRAITDALFFEETREKWFATADDSILWLIALNDKQPNKKGPLRPESLNAVHSGRRRPPDETDIIS